MSLASHIPLPVDHQSQSIRKSSALTKTFLEMDFMKCPKCDHRMRMAFCNRASGLSCVEPDQFAYAVVRDTDLSGSAWRNLIPWTASWHPAHLCEACGMYAVEYRRTFSRKQVEAIIDRMQDEIISAGF